MELTPTAEQYNVLAANERLQIESRQLENELEYRRHHSADHELTERLQITGLTSREILARLRENAEQIKKLDLRKTCESFVRR